MLGRCGILSMIIYLLAAEWGYPSINQPINQPTSKTGTSIRRGSGPYGDDLFGIYGENIQFLWINCRNQPFASASRLESGCITA